MENFISVVHDITFHTILVLVIIFNIDVRVIKVKVSFLLDNLTEDIYMVLPPGYHLLKENENALHNLVLIGRKQTTAKYRS